MLDQVLQPAPAQPLSPAALAHHRVRLIAVMIAMLVGAGLVALSTVTFHPPTSLVEALLPRL